MGEGEDGGCCGGTPSVTAFGRDSFPSGEAEALRRGEGTDCHGAERLAMTNVEGVPDERKCRAGCECQQRGVGDAAPYKRLSIVPTAKRAARPTERNGTIEIWLWGVALAVRA